MNTRIAKIEAEWCYCPEGVEYDYWVENDRSEHFGEDLHCRCCGQAFLDDASHPSRLKITPLLCHWCYANREDEWEAWKEANRLLWRAVWVGKRCVECGEQAEVADHIIPKALGGEHRYENLQPMCWHCNSSKGVGVPKGRRP